MPIEIVTMRCPTCGGEIDLEEECCSWCFNKIQITTYEEVEKMTPIEVRKHMDSYNEVLQEAPDNKVVNTSAGLCFLKLKQYDMAHAAFVKAMEHNYDNAEVYYYGAIALLQGKMPFLHMRPTIDKALSYLDTATMIDPKGIYYYFMAYIKYDYFKRKFLNTTPDYNQLFAQARQAGITQDEVSQLYSLLNTQRPACL